LRTAYDYCYNDHEMTEVTHKQRIIVVGGGFGGIKAAIELSKYADLFDITLVSDRPDFWYFPTLYHTATGGTRSQSSIPIEQLLHKKEVKFIEGKAVSVDRDTKTLTLEDKQVITYDKIIFALGVITNYFGIPGLPEYSYGIKSIGEAERLKRHVHQQIVSTGKPDLNYVIVGGGPTGIELAGAIGRYVAFVTERHGLPERKIHVDLVEGNKHLMPRMPKAVGKAIERQLRSVGIKLYLGKTVEGETADELSVGGKPIRSHTVVWTAGQANNPFFADNSFPISSRRKVMVDEFLRVKGSDDMFVIGDNADTMYSGMAQTAVYDGEFIADNFHREATNRPKLAYRPKKPVYVTPAGGHWAAVEWGPFHLYGWLGWFLREAADFIAFTDIEPVPDAATQWAHGLESQHLCPICGSVA
jgi:NADH:ubiquinone reductase (H+-translocating)